MISLRKTRRIHDTKKQTVRLCPTLRNFREKKQIKLLSFISNLKGMFDNFGECEGGTVRCLAYSLSDSTEEVHEAYTSSGMNSNAHVCYETWAVVIKACRHLSWQKTYYREHMILFSEPLKDIVRANWNPRPNLLRLRNSFVIHFQRWRKRNSKFVARCHLFVNLKTYVSQRTFKYHWLQVYCSCRWTLPAIVEENPLCITSYNSTTFRLANCLKINNRSLQCWMPSSARLWLLSQRTAGGLITRSVVIRIIVGLPKHIHTGSK